MISFSIMCQAYENFKMEESHFEAMSRENVSLVNTESSANWNSCFKIVIKKGFLWYKERTCIPVRIPKPLVVECIIFSDDICFEIVIMKILFSDGVI